MPLFRLYIPLLASAALWGGQRVYAQVDTAHPYVLNGAAARNTCKCYTLTPSTAHQNGSVWNKNKIDLSRSFDFHFDIFLGCRSDSHGADGIAFVLQPISASIGSEGEGLGFEGITPSLGVTIDTYDNAPDDDPPYDHLAFQSNGVVNHADTNNLAGPVQALADSPNIKDCSWHVLEVKWDAPSSTLNAYVDGVFRLGMTRDIVGRIFRGNAQVFWGFTASTGSGYNLQEFCTSLDAHYGLAGQQTCEGSPITFRDSSTSFGAVQQWYWDFGDGTGSTLRDPPPHVFPEAGVYVVTQAIAGIDGCTSDTSRTTIVIGTYPKTLFTVGNACTGRPLPLTNASTDSIGGFGAWRWMLSNGETATDSLPTLILSQPGDYTLRLSTVSTLGCPGDTLSRAISVYPTPLASFAGDTVCTGRPLVLRGVTPGDVPIRQWYWALGASLDSAQTISRVYTTEETLSARLWVVSTRGCVSDTVTQTIDIQASHANAGQDTVAALGYPIRLHASGGTGYAWSPPAGLDDPDSPDPVATLTRDMRYTLTAYTSAGCPSVASILIKVYKGPAIYVPGAFTPNGDGINDVLRIVAPGIGVLSYFRIFDRWGREVYHSTDLQAAWDGTVSGHPAPAGAYVWMIRGADLNGRVLNQRGTVLVIR